MLSLTVRTWLRYLVPLTAIAAITMVVVAYTGLRAGVATDLVFARAEMRLGWELAATAWIFQLLLVAAAAPMVRAIAAGTPLSQAAAFAHGLGNVARALVPIGVVIFAIVLGSVAFVIPGLLLLGLFALTGASDQLAEPLPAPLLDSVAVVRAHAKQIALVVAIIIAADLAIAAIAHVAILPALTKKPPVALLASARTFVRVIAVSLIALSALPACALAAVYVKHRSE
ncbi:MAG: hypothetical protein ABI591_19080 [Kofleriaceae bacterium]